MSRAAVSVAFTAAGLLGWHMGFKGVVGSIIANQLAMGAIWAIQQTVAGMIMASAILRFVDWEGLPNPAQTG